MQDTQQNIPRKMNMDKAAESLSQEEAFYLLNHERSLSSNGKKKASLGKTTGMVSNYAACEIDQPAGENYSVGSYKSSITNEEYEWTYNSNGVHYIKRISDNGCEIVYEGCLPLSPEPQHAIEQFRAYLKVTKTCKNRGGKDLLWVDGSDNPIGQLDVEASIATNFFTTPFFQHPCSDPCDYVRNVVPRPCACISAEYIPLPSNEVGLENSLLDRGFKFIYRHRYYDGRVSEWSDPSTMYYQDSKGCFEGGIGFSRCMNLRIPIGNPMVEKIEIGFSDDNGMTWYLYDTIEKYNPYTQPSQQWYERTLSPEITSTLTPDCYFTTTFCNNKQRINIDRKEVTRTYNPVPRGAQGIIPIKDSLGFYNYKKGNCPVGESEARKIQIKLDCKDTNCEIKYANVTIRAVIHNTGYHLNQMIYRMKKGGEDDKGDQAWFGGLRVRSREYQGGYADGEGWMAGYDQYFRKDFRNFVVYVEGTEYWGEMKQWRADRNFQGRREVGVVSGFEDSDTRNTLRRQQQHGTFYYQEYTFRVPKGTSGFLRMQSHRAQEFEPNTSTFVLGTVNLRQYKGDADISGIIQRNKEEIFFDTCNGDVTFDEAFVIHDNAVDLALKKRASAYFGYVTDENNSPVEGLRITDHNEVNAVRSITDHNGFFHFYINAGIDGEAKFTIAGERDSTGVFKKIKDIFIQSQSGANTEANTQIYDGDVSDYKTNYYAIATIRVRDCDGAGIGGVRVALSGSKSGITDAQGFARIRVRNHDYRARTFRAVIADSKGCFSLDCAGNCNPCMPSSFANGFASYNNRPVIVMPDLIVNRNPALNMVSGLKAGGRYAFGFVLEGDDIQSSVIHKTYIDIPSTQMKNKLSFCDIGFDMGTAKFDKRYKCLKFVRTMNLNPYRLQWVVDKIERTATGRVKLTIQSLNDYNEEYNFRTNTVYSYLQGDRVEFIRNGDAKIFDTATYGQMNFLTVSPFHDRNVSGKEDVGADYFNQILINDDARLIDVKEGAIIEIKPQSIEQNDQQYFTICASVELDNGSPVIKKGSFHTFDTFIVTRKIGEFPSLPFEHHSPSDFWVNPIPDSPIGYSDIGRPHAINPYEDERRYGRNISLTTASELNVFGYIEKTFDAPEQGDIIAMAISDSSQVFAVCEKDWFTAPTADDLLKMTNDGNVRVVRGEEAIGDPQPKSGRYGCQYEHVGGVLFGDGFASWYDVENGNFILSDWSAAQPASKGVSQSYLIHMAQVMEKNNRMDGIHALSKYRCTTGYDRVTGRIFLTLKSLRHSGIDNAYFPYTNPNNTISFDPATGDCLGFCSFTPDRYGHVEIYDGNGCAFLSYLQGVPYIHPEIPKSYNEFYGVSCDRVVGIAINKYADKIKMAQAIEIKSNMMWFSPDVRTDNEKYRSEIVPAKVEGVANKWSSSFFGNINSPDGLYGEDRPKGYAIRVTLVRDNTVGNKYRSVNPDKQKEYDELDIITTKFAIVEQSGFSANR